MKTGAVVAAYGGPGRYVSGYGWQVVRRMNTLLTADKLPQRAVVLTASDGLAMALGLCILLCLAVIVFESV